jgi:glycosyltransferase involved in cell wall biosynthesis
MHQYRERHFPLIFLPSRQLWKSRPHKFSNKGTDILVRGFADFVKNASGADPCLVMLEYGLDVDATKRLVGELGIEDHVRWLPMLPRRDIMACLTYCDVVGTHFGHGFFMSGVTFEALSMAKPIMGRRDNDNMNAEFAEDYPELYPIMNVNSSEGVTAALGDFLDRPDHYAEMGKRGREWYLTEVVERFQKEIRGLIKGAGTVNR